jgi:hypothetical protein
MDWSFFRVLLFPTLLKFLLLLFYFIIRRSRENADGSIGFLWMETIKTASWWSMPKEILDQLKFKTSVIVFLKKIILLDAAYLDFSS